MTILTLLLALLSAAPEASAHPLRRFLLATANEFGGQEKARLRYSHTDARSVATVMERLGGIASSRVVVLREADTARFLSEFQDLSRRMENARDSGYRVELMVYYSGHSDESGLLLGSTRLSYARLRRTLETAPADVRLAVLDACASGAALRTKGGMRRQAFHIEGAERLRGQAFLTSSRAEESSLESDRIGGSFFTQAFLTGLLGAADRDADGRITLLEAYRYAYEETVASTASTRTGAQHPEFDLDLSGSGDVVLTDLREAGSVLEIPDSAGGSLTISDSNGVQVAGLRKSVGRSLSLGLPAGSYRIECLGDSVRRISHLQLVAGVRRTFDPAVTDSVAPVIPPVPVAADAPAPRADSLAWRPVNIGIFTPWSVNGEQAARARNVFSLDLAQGKAARIDGLQLATAATFARTVNGLQIGSLYADAGQVCGLQVAALVAKNGGGFQGLQTSVLDWNGKEFQGLQTGVAAWNGGDFRGLQASVIGGSAGDFSGLQAGVVGWNGGDFHGLQTGVYGQARDVTGAQITVLSIGGSVTGAQIGVINLGGTVHGTQIGVVNVASKVKGAQVGVVNLAGLSEGAVVGVVNLARDLKALPVGLMSGGWNMHPQLETWVDASGWGAFALRLDGERFHSRLAALAGVSDPARRLGAGFGFGAHWLPAQAWRLDADLLARSVWNNPEHGEIASANWNSVSADVQRKLGSAWIFVGISANILNSSENHAGAFTDPVKDFRPSSDVSLWPSLFAGVALSL